MTAGMHPTLGTILVTPNRNVVPAYSADLFDQEYFRTGCGPLPYERATTDLLQLFVYFAEELIRLVHPKTVFDAGCAMGFLVEAFWDRGVAACGVDISPYAISHVRRDMQPHCRIASLTQSIEGRYDLVTCIEVLEHMPWDHSHAAIKNLSCITDTILFSSSPSDFAEPTHINVHQPIVWLEEFGSVGFYPDPSFDASFVTPQAMLLRRSDRPLDWDLLQLYAERLRCKIAPAEASTLERTSSESKRHLGTLITANRQLDTLVSASRADARREPLQAESGLNSVPGTLHASLQGLLAQICLCLDAAEAAVESSRVARASLVQVFHATAEEWQVGWRQLERAIEEIQVRMNELTVVPIEQGPREPRESASPLKAQLASRLESIRLTLKRSENIEND
jgi:2-polyprenyl-3-methyl-5-hydroxy-6-metoxy-1,4-benzoquinol methylase